MLQVGDMCSQYSVPYYSIIPRKFSFHINVNIKRSQKLYNDYSIKYYISIQWKQVQQ